MRLPPARLETVLLLLPVTLLIGTNVPFLEAAGRNLSIGTNELVLAALMGGLCFRWAQGYYFAPLPRDLMLAVGLYSLMPPLSLLVNVLLTGDMPASRAWVEVIRWYEYLPILPAIFWLVKSNRQTQAMLRLAGVCVLMNVVVALYQAATFDVSESRVYGLFVSAANRAGDSISNPNVIGSVFMGAALFFLAFALTRQGRSRGFDLLYMALSIVAMTLTLSRSAMLGFLLGVVVLSFFYREQRRLFLAIGLTSLLTLAVTVVVSDMVLTRLINTLQLSSGTVDAKSVTSRYENWSFMFWKTLESPLFGLGYGDIERRSDYRFTTADNYYIEIYATMGVFGVLALANLFWQIAAPVVHARIAPQTFAYTVRCGFLACFAAFAADLFAAGLLMEPHLIGLFWMLTALARQTVRINARNEG